MHVTSYDSWNAAEQLLRVRIPIFRWPPEYVGYGESADRAIAHAAESHNTALRDRLKSSKFDLTIAGPYRDDVEGKNVESALIAALQPEFNRSPGEGRKFVPLGVPVELSDRPGENPVSVAEIGREGFGALLVYLAPGQLLGDGRPKFDPARVDDAVVLSNMDRAWSLTRLVEVWRDPASSPRHLVGIYGSNPAHRFIVGIVPIDIAGWGDPTLRVYKDRWRVPVRLAPGLDACGLRGRRVANAKFGNMSWQLHIWVDSTGAILHPVPKI